jgi:hypothetical protein
MLTSEVIEKLNTLKALHGDVQFCILDADTEWVLKTSSGCFKFVEDNFGKRIEVGATYLDLIE